jgi:hypothetical protein
MTSHQNTYQSKLDTRNSGLHQVTYHSIGDVNTPPVCGHLCLVMQKEVRRAEVNELYMCRKEARCACVESAAQWSGE